MDYLYFLFGSHLEKITHFCVRTLYLNKCPYIMNRQCAANMLLPFACMRQCIGAANHLAPICWCFKCLKSPKYNYWCGMLTFLRLQELCIVQLAKFYQYIGAASHSTNCSRHSSRSCFPGRSSFQGGLAFWSSQSFSAFWLFHFIPFTPRPSKITYINSVGVANSL